MIVRDYTPSDWPTVCRVHDAARPLELAAGAVDPRAFRSMADAAADDEFFISQTLVACVNEAVVGFVSWNGSYLSWLYVDPAFHRRGIARKLLQAALDHIGPEAWTNMIAGNSAALALYSQCGLEVVRTRSTDCDGYPCLGMRLALPTSRMHDPEARRERLGS